jgi:succinoglycan biosynthesis transport protein ExoP
MEETNGPAPDNFAYRETSNHHDSLLWYYLDVIRRRIWLLLPILVITTTVGTIKAFQAPVLYRAVAKLLVERNAPQLMQFERGLQEGFAWDPDFYNTQCQLLRSRAVMEIALQQPGITELFKSGPATESTAPRTGLVDELKRTFLAATREEPLAPPEPWERLRANIQADHITDTHFLQVIVVHPSPYRAAKLANAAASGFKDYHWQRKIESLGEAFALLEKEKQEAEANLLKAEADLQRYRESARGLSLDPDSVESPAVERLGTLNRELTEVQLQRIEISSALSVMRGAMESEEELAGDAREQLFSVPAVQSDGTLSDARQSLATAEKEMATLGREYGPAHPRMQAAQAKVDLLWDQFKTALNELIRSQENRLAQLQNREDELKATYERERKQALDLSKESFTLGRLRDVVERNRRLYDALLERMREVEVSSGLVKTNVQIVEKATVPHVPIPVNKTRKIVLSILMGLFLGGGLAFVFENLDNTIKTPEDLRDRFRVPLLGFVPAIEGDGEAGDTASQRAKPGGPLAGLQRGFWNIVCSVRPELLPQIEDKAPRGSLADRMHRGSIVLKEPVSSVAEAYRSIRTNLLYSTPGHEVRLLVVTSCRPREGKTTTTINLALSLAQIGKRVLLIDADLHRPMVHETLKLSRERGLTSALVGEHPWREVVQQIVHEGRTIENLDVLVAGPTSPNPSELLGSTAMRDLLQDMRGEYDWVFVDTPPILFVSDASVLSVATDGVIMVVKAGTSTPPLLARAKEQLDNVRARVLGCILNSVMVSRVGRYYSTYYNYGYSRYAKNYHSSYYADDADEAEEERQPEAAPPAASAAGQQPVVQAAAGSSSETTKRVGKRKARRKGRRSRRA